MELEFLKEGIEVNRYNIKFATPCEAYVIGLRRALDGCDWNHVADSFYCKYDKQGNTKAIPIKPFNKPETWIKESLHCIEVRDSLLKECEFYLEENNRWKVFTKNY